MNTKLDAITRVFTMPDLPAAAICALAILRRPGVNTAGLAALVESDPAWMSEVLKLAGMLAWKECRDRICLEDLFGRIGHRRIAQLVAISAAAPLLRGPVPGYGLAEGELWDHSLAVALATREILRERGLKPCEEAFTAAFLHDVGKLVLGGAAETEPTADPDDEIPIEEAETVRFGLSHADAGALLLGHWNMPYWLVAAVRWHHATTDSSFLVADLIHLADALCLSAGLGTGRDGLRFRVSTAVSSRWNLSRRSVELILERTLDALAEAKDATGAGKGR